MATPRVNYVPPSYYHFQDKERHISSVCTYGETLFIADRTGDVYKVENDTKKIFCQHFNARIDFMIATDNVLWCFRTDGIFSSLYAWDTENGKTRVPHIQSPGSVLQVRVWGSFVVILGSKIYNTCIQAAHAYYAPKTICGGERQTEDTPNNIAVWGDYLCVSFDEGNIWIYSHEIKVIQKIGNIFGNRGIRYMAGCGEFLYIVCDSLSIARCNRIGEVTHIYRSNLRDSDYESYGLVLSQDQVFGLHNEYSNTPNAGANHGYLYDIGSCEGAPKDVVAFGCFFKWMDQVWTLSANRTQLISWNLSITWTPKTHSKFPKEVRTIVKSLLTVAYLNRLPVVNMPNELLHHIIQVLIAEWTPKNSKKFPKELTECCTKRARLQE